MLNLCLRLKLSVPLDNEVKVTDVPDKPLVESKVEKEENLEKDEEQEQELVKRVQELSVVPPVDDGVDFGHDALEATSSAEVELAPDPLKKSSTLPVKEKTPLPSLPDAPIETEASPDPSLPVSSPPYNIPSDLASSFVRDNFYASVTLLIQIRMSVALR